MNNLKLARLIFEKEQEKLVKAIGSAKHARDNAPSPMESHHDNTRSDNERLARALEEKLRFLEKQITSIPSILPVTEEVEEWRYVEVQIETRTLKLLIVPKGLGGSGIDGIQLISLDTPLGLEIAGKRAGEKFKLNNQEGKVLSIE